MDIAGMQSNDLQPAFQGKQNIGAAGLNLYSTSNVNPSQIAVFSIHNIKRTCTKILLCSFLF